MSWPVSVTTFGPVQAGSLLWTFKGTVRVTFVLRTAFGLGADVTQAPPGAVERVEAHYKSDPAKPVRTPSDLAPRVPRAEIVHAGVVAARAGVSMVRLAILRGSDVVVDKRGVAAPNAESSGLGPLGPGAPGRHALLRGFPEPRPDARGVVSVADGFNFSFYQCAPLDQQTDVLLGGDRIVLANLDPDAADLTVTMPSRAPAARAILGGEEAPVPLECKRVIVDTDRRIYVLVWYGELEVPNLASVPYLRLEARMAEVGAMMKVDTGSKAQPPPRPLAGPSRRNPLAAAGTLVMDERPELPPAPTPAPASVAPPTAPGRAKAHSLSGTVVIDDEPPAPKK